MGAQRLPPLNALRAFEVAARRLSFKDAADELSITPTAVSHRIRTLEEWLGLRLFNRLTRGLELTKEGEAYAARVHTGFAELIAASDSLRHSVELGELVIATTMSFASNWLAPRLVDFYGRKDGFTVRVEASDSVVDLDRSNVDMAIRLGEGGYKALHSQMLFAELATVVCTPELATHLRSAEDVLELPLIEYRWSGHGPEDPTWGRWLAAAGKPMDVSVVPAWSFGDEHIALSQALAGGGAALVGLTASARCAARRTARLPVPDRARGPCTLLRLPSRHARAA